MVKFISLVAIVLPAVLSVAQAAYILSSGQLKGTHIIHNVNCAGSTKYTLATETLKAGGVFCSYLPAIDMSLCQCHQADVTAKNLDGFTADILEHVLTLGVCTDKKGGLDYASDGTWINGFYEGLTFMSAAGFSKGKVTINGCKPVGCTTASQGLSWRNLKTVSANC
ncbi:hypothetical protein EMPS_10647 [Entomortierella parvispora]|uniref:Uncharacterized protein n=1 Tax=Entomortierella parvispora TaxID=205924 RepID=A0A9P3HKZ7_9FUNG|nr:hypothetical protein EMPS_10647 [Entomortierella parvispora]